MERTADVAFDTYADALEFFAVGRFRRLPVLLESWAASEAGDDGEKLITIARIAGRDDAGGVSFQLSTRDARKGA